MAFILQVTVTNDETGEVEKTYAETFDSGNSWEAAESVRRLLARIFSIVYPGSDEW